MRAVLSRLRLLTDVLQLTGLMCVPGASVMAYAPPPPRAALLSSATSRKRTRGLCGCFCDVQGQGKVAVGEWTHARLPHV